MVCWHDKVCSDNPDTPVLKLRFECQFESSHISTTLKFSGLLSATDIIVHGRCASADDSSTTWEIFIDYAFPGGIVGGYFSSLYSVPGLYS
jgi:hypothetical protein